ncbi:MAG: chemotaxis protein CheD [Chloroflexi bacterium]|nr:chemotaxis protein CheD [Chloroflexota bacterium]
MTALASELRRISVGIGQLAVSSDAGEVLVAYGLGSCVGVSAYDPSLRLGGLVHILLPDSEGRGCDGREPARFADIGIDSLIRRMVEGGALKGRLTVKMVGGAAVLGAANAGKFKIGERNAEAIKERLLRHGLRPAAEDLGGVKGRTFEVHIGVGRTYVRTAASSPTEL